MPARLVDLLPLIGSLDKPRTEINYRPAETIFRQGQPARSVYFLQAGRVKINITSARKEGTVGIIDSGEFFGECCLGGTEAYSYTASALTQVTVTVIAKEVMVGLMRYQPQFASLFVTHLVERKLRVEADLVDQLFNTAEQRLARLLLTLVRFGEDGPQTIPKEITQDMLAQLVGSTRTRINYFMNSFRKRGFIRYNGEIEVYATRLVSVLQGGRRK